MTFNDCGFGGFHSPTLDLKPPTLNHTFGFACSASAKGTTRPPFRKTSSDASSRYTTSAEMMKSYCTSSCDAPSIFQEISQESCKIQTLQTSNMSIWNELWWGLWQNAPFAIHCLIQKVGHGFQSMLWCELKQSYSRASCFDAYTFAKCSATSDKWYIHQLKLLLRASLVLHLQASKQPLFNWLWTIAATILKQRCSAILSSAQSVRQGTTLDAQSVRVRSLRLRQGCPSWRVSQRRKASVCQPEIPELSMQEVLDLALFSV